MNTAVDGNSTKAMKKFKGSRDEHVEMMQGGQGGEWGWLTWLFSGSWRSIMTQIGIALRDILMVFVVMLYNPTG